MFIKLHENVRNDEQINNENNNIDNYDENDPNNANNDNETERETREIFSWDDAKTKLFLQLYKEKQDLLRNRKIKNKKMLWEKIRENMQKHGYNITLVQVENKFKSLERSYKNMILNNKKTGRSRMSCPYET